MPCPPVAGPGWGWAELAPAVLAAVASAAAGAAAAAGRLAGA